MSILSIILCVSLGFATLAFVMTIVNLIVYTRPPDTAASGPLVTVCIPARNEEENIAACVRSVLASGHANIEVLVYDDQSTDRTPAIVRDLIASDSRVRGAETVSLPAGWNGKQHACWRMGQQARGEWMVFTDADVRFEPQCIGRALAAAGQRRASLVSTFPRQITGSVAEDLAVPMIFFVLFSYLPMPMMRMGNSPTASAGCGQFLMVTREAYDKSGGHAAFKDSMHDGVKMPREVRRAGFHTDLFDGTDLISVRMYRGLAQTWRGFTKNAFEGIGSLGLLGFFTVVHLLAHVLPWAVVLLAASRWFSGTLIPDWRAAGALAAVCVSLNLIQRLLLSVRFRQGIIPVLLHPVGVLFMTVIQWYSLYLARTNRRAWRGRVGVGAAAPG
ncbi:MAG: glycosyltransferase [Phycisphaeraceae bacterium]|nr:glycosyltransferase [Phycisphaeraceae bacterium]